MSNKKKIAFIHTVAGPYAELAKEILPDVETMHIMDELLLKTVVAAGGLTPFIYRRVVDNVVAAEQAGANLVQVTCSSISPVVDITRLMVSIPVLKIDEPMVEKAIAMGKRIGIAATSPSTLGPTTDLTYRKAEAEGKDVNVDSVLCEGAFNALYYQGDTDTHDRIVRDYLQQMIARNDVIMLAQGSMARVADTIPAEEKTIPILTSPRLALERAKQVLYAAG
jgi:Asp/Glu/hydantoin racemase